MYYEEYLYHHGVKGQRWGVRRYQNKDGTLIHPKRKQRQEERAAKTAEKKSAKETAEAAKRQNYIRKHPSKMTAEELKAETERLKSLKEYRNLYAEVNGTVLDGGKRFMKDHFKTIAGRAIDEVGTKLLIQGGRALTSKLLGSDTATDIFGESFTQKAARERREALEKEQKAEKEKRENERKQAAEKREKEAKAEKTKQENEKAKAETQKAKEEARKAEEALKNHKREEEYKDRIKELERQLDKSNRDDADDDDDDDEKKARLGKYFSRQ